MMRLDVATQAPPRDISLTTPPNWTAVIFFACLSGLHFCISIPAFYHGRWEGYLSFIFAILFAATSVISYFVRYEVTVMPVERKIQYCTGLGRFSMTRSIPFSDVHAIRLTLGASGKAGDTSLEILCDNEDINCPPTNIPRQQALFLAITLGVELIKVCNDDQDILPDRSDRAV